MDRIVDQAAVPAVQDPTNTPVFARGLDSSLRPSGGPTLEEQELHDTIREIAQERDAALRELDEARTEVLQLRALTADLNALAVFLNERIAELRASQSVPAGPVLSLAA